MSPESIPTESLNILFLFFCIALVFLMQIGFLCLEAGAVRSKNSINVATKNLLDLIIVTLIYAFLGFYVQYGSFYELIEISERSKSYLYLFLIFQTLFAATTTTIVSGAVAERCGLKGYLIISFLIASLIYPIAGQWVWGGVLGSSEGWLAQAGFVDFAGSTTVHTLGGSVALASIIIIGPRTGIYDNASVKGQNFVISLMGVLFLWLGWFGFNAGSLLSISGLLPIVVANTFIAGSAGGLSGIVWSYIFKRKIDLPIIANTLLSGLVGITASAHAITADSALLIGFSAGLLCAAAMQLMNALQLDDVIGAVPVHLVAGIWGTLAVALFGDLDALATGLGRWEQLRVQALGSTAVVFWAFGSSFLLLSIINYFLPLRVSKEAELIGLNTAEHGAVSEMSDLIRQLETQASTGQFTWVDVDTFSDLSVIAQQYNLILNRFMQSQSLMKLNIESLESVRDELQQQKANVENANQHKDEFLAKMSHELLTPLNGIIGITEVMDMNTLSDEQKEFIDTIKQSGESLLSIVQDVLDFSTLESGQLTLARLPYNPDKLLKECISIFTPETLERPIDLILDISSDLPRQLNGDESRMKQVIICLLGNAFKFTESGFVKLNARYDVMTDMLTITVSDSGKGITDDYIKSIFSSFEQEDNSTKRQFGGSGLGLSITKQLVELMGGQISVLSQPGEGSTFTMSFNTHS